MIVTIVAVMSMMSVDASTTYHYCGPNMELRMCSDMKHAIRNWEIKREVQYNKWTGTQELSTDADTERVSCEAAGVGIFHEDGNGFCSASNCDVANSLTGQITSYTPHYCDIFRQHYLRSCCQDNCLNYGCPAGEQLVKNYEQIACKGKCTHDNCCEARSDMPTQVFNVHGSQTSIIAGNKGDVDANVKQEKNVRTIEGKKCEGSGNGNGDGAVGTVCCSGKNVQCCGTAATMSDHDKWHLPALFAKSNKPVVSTNVKCTAMGATDTAAKPSESQVAKISEASQSKLSAKLSEPKTENSNKDTITISKTVVQAGAGILGLLLIVVACVCWKCCCGKRGKTNKSDSSDSYMEMSKPCCGGDESEYEDEEEDKA